jgi:hypothetical protein
MDLLKLFSLVWSSFISNGTIPVTSISTCASFVSTQVLLGLCACIVHSIYQYPRSYQGVLTSHTTLFLLPLSFHSRLQSASPHAQCAHGQASLDLFVRFAKPSVQ